MLPNLTFFSLAHNALYDIPSDLISRFPALATLDLTGNQFIHYYPEFTQNIKSGLDMRYYYCGSPDENCDTYFSDMLTIISDVSAL